MKISFNWLKKYINTEISVEETGQILTDTGLEVESIEKIEAVKGGLEGVVIGKVLTCEKHPDADKLKVTTVDVGTGTLQIVCGAPNVAAGQTVVVATVGCTLYPKPDEPFKIKAAKIRGVDSFGMLCAEDELGIGESHAGIMVLPDDLAIGSNAATYFDLEDDYQLEIGLTPNRADAMGHIGVARDLMAHLNFHKKLNLKINWPKVNELNPTSNFPITIKIEDKENCSRYCGVTITDVKVAPSPEWLQKSLRAVGLTPINNVVDVTNFVMRELGTPLHAFDADLLSGQIVVKKATKDSKFVTLDGVERTLSGEELMISNGIADLCIAGVFGGLTSGIKSETQNVFLESAVFNSVSVRKTARNHGLNTDASFRFERGVDSELTFYALQRAANLIIEVAGGSIGMNPEDVRTENFENKNSLKINLDKINQLIGYQIPKEEHISILSDLDFKILSENESEIELKIPAYRIDVTLEADVAEEVLRIYGFNNIPLPDRWHLAVNSKKSIDRDKIQGTISELLVAKGFYEVLNNSLTKTTYAVTFESEILKSERNVRLLNPLSQDLEVMRQSLVFGLMENIQRNQNRQNPNLKLFEFGKNYHLYPSGYEETNVLAIAITGSKSQELWNSDKDLVSYYTLKGIIKSLFDRLGLFDHLKFQTLQNELFSDGEKCKILKKDILEIGLISQKLLDHFDIKNPVYCAFINWDQLIESLKIVKINFKELPKTFAVRRDFSLLLNKETTYGELKETALNCDKKLLREVNLFDVYEGKNLETGKKSYALSFTFQDQERTLTDSEIDTVMNKIKTSFEEKFGASLR
ncbi:MAG: phenylalanine--tRNA ligase subunit beta [Crocinitomicaceae bacterium]